MLASSKVLRTASRHARGFSGVAPTQKTLFQRLFDHSNMLSVPLNEEYPNVPPPSPAIQRDENPRISTLANGIRVVSIEDGSALSAVGVFADAGTRYETHETAGISHFLEKVAFKSTNARSEFRLIRDMLQLGANVSCFASRENIIYTGDSLRPDVPAVIATFADVINNHKFREYELKLAKEDYEFELEERANDAASKVSEGILAAGYNNNSYGLPLYAPQGNLANFTAETLLNYQRTFFRPERLVVAAVGYGHEELKAVVERSFQFPDNLPAAPVKQQAVWTGGETRIHDREATNVNVSLAFETGGWHSADLVPVCVLQVLLGGGGAFSAGGPGKGMHSRLYLSVLNEHAWVESANAQNVIHNDSGLFGINGTAAAKDAGKLADVFSEQLAGLAKAPSDYEFKRAKNTLKSNVLMHLESRPMLLEDIGKQLSTYGKILSSQELCEQIDRVTPADLQRVGAQLLKSKLAVAAYGDLTYFPRYDVLAKRFS